MNTIKTALVAIAAPFEKNYLLEWVTYHHLLGFDDIYIYQNNARFDKLCLPNFVNLIEWDGKCKQLPAYNDFIDKHKDDYDFAMFMDCDEYLFFKDIKMKDYLDKCKLVPAIGFNWKLFGSSGLMQPNLFMNDYSCIFRFQKSQKGINQHIKTMLNLKYCRDCMKVVPHFINPHFVDYATMYSFTYQPDFKRTVFGPFNCYGNDDIAYIAHYVTKSYSEFLERRSHVRADIDSPREDIEKFWTEHDRNDVENHDLADWYSYNMSGIKIVR